MAEKPKYVQYTTPRGPLGYSYFDKPDTKFAKPGEKGVYKSDVTVSAVKFASLKAKIDEAVDAQFDKTKVMLAERAEGEKDPAKKGKIKAKLKELKKVYPYEAVLDAEGEETDKVKVKTKANAEFTSKKTGKTHSNKPVVFDKNGTPFEGQVYAGSVAALSIELNPYFMESAAEVGCSLRLKAAMVYQAAAQGQRDASAYGFAAEDDDDETSNADGGDVNEEDDEADVDDEF